MFKKSPKRQAILDLARDYYAEHGGDPDKRISAMTGDDYALLRLCANQAWLEVNGVDTTSDGGDG